MKREQGLESSRCIVAVNPLRESGKLGSVRVDPRDIRIPVAQNTIRADVDAGGEARQQIEVSRYVAEGPIRRAVVLDLVRHRDGVANGLCSTTNLIKA